MSNNILAAFGILSEGDDELSVQSSIPRALGYLSPRDQNAFLKKFSEQVEDEHQVMHTFRELLAGVFMAQQGYTPSYEPDIGGLTPDWHFQCDGRGEFIADVVNFHVEKKIEAQIDCTLERSDVWSGKIPDQSQRLYSSLWNKAGRYKNLAAEKNVPYVVFIFGWMNAVVESSQIEQCLLHAEGLFQDYPTLSGVYFMYEPPSKFSTEAVCIGEKILLSKKEIKERILGLLEDKDLGYCFDYYANSSASYPAPCLTSGRQPYRFPAFSNQSNKAE